MPRGSVTSLSGRWENEDPISAREASPFNLIHCGYAVRNLLAELIQWVDAEPSGCVWVGSEKAADGTVEVEKKVGRGDT